MENDQTHNQTLQQVYETLIYETKGAVKMYSCFLSEEQKYFVIIRPWGDQTPPLNYLKLCRAGQGLPKNVRAYIHESLGVIKTQIKEYKQEKSKYIRKKRNKKTTEAL
jgi:hypothetical protein